MKSRGSQDVKLRPEEEADQSFITFSMASWVSPLRFWLRPQRD